MKIEAKDQIDVRFGDVSYVAEFKYGNDWTDGDEREYPWAEVLDCKAFNSQGEPCLIRPEHMRGIEDACLHRAAEILNIEL